MAFEDTRPPGAGQADPVPVRDNIIQFGERRIRRRAAAAPSPAEDTPAMRRQLRPAALLGYFSCWTIPFRVAYGSSGTAWVAAADTYTGERPRSWGDFAALDRYGRFRPFAMVKWTADTTRFIYTGPEMEPEWMPLHSPREAMVLYKVLELYWHCCHGTTMVDPTLLANTAPEYVDPADPSALGQ